MRPRFLIFISIIVLAILALLFWGRSVQSPANVAQSQVTVQSTNAPIAIANTVSKNAPAVTPTPATKLLDANDVRTPEGFKRYVEGHNIPVEFYGKFIDQDSNALSGVDIKVLVRHWTMPMPTVLLVGSKEILLEQISGSDGRFELAGATGDGFDITSIQKDGYEVESGSRSFGAVGGSYDNPVIFKMWSDNIHEKLIAGQKAFQIVPDGRSYFINLTNGTISESGTGDLRIWIKRPAQITYGQRYNWSCEMDVVNGGLLEELAGSAMYEAPADGYVPSFVFNQNIGSGWGDATGVKHFYIDLNNGRQYGNIAIELCAYYNDQIPALIRLSYAINPSGSRILR